MEDDVDFAAIVFNDTVAEKSGRRGVSLSTIEKELKNKGFEHSIITKVIVEYSNITGGTNYQDQRRKGLLYACLQIVYLREKEPKDPRSLAQQMEIELKVASRGEDMYTSLSKKQGINISTLESSDVQQANLFIEQLFTTKEKWFDGKLEYGNSNRINLVDDVKEKVSIIIDGIKNGNKANIAKSAKPRTIAAAAIYFHCVAAMGLKIDKKRYAELCGCSPVSVDKHHNNIVLFLQDLRDISKKQKKTPPINTPTKVKSKKCSAA